MEKKKKRSMLPILFILPVLAVFIFSLVKIGGPLLEYRQGEKVYESLEEYVSIGEDGSYREGEMPVDFEALRKVNPDIIGWIVIPGMEISYPIVQGEDNDYYLKHTFDKAENASGCIFVEVENSPDFSDNNTFVYGHNMKNKSMFAKLNRYQEEDTFRKNPEFIICRILVFEGIISANRKGLKFKQNLYLIIFLFYLMQESQKTKFHGVKTDINNINRRIRINPLPINTT